MTRRLRCLLLLSGLVVAAPAYATNYLVIVLDDVGADKVSGYADIMYPGYSPTYLPETPAIDTLAAVGLRFSHAYVSPMCSPTRGALLTGEYPFQTEIGNVLSPMMPAPELSAATTTIPEMLTESSPGAAVSALFGKWHLGMTTPGGSDWASTGERAEAPAPGLHGFSTYIGNLDGQVASYYDWLETSWPETLSTGAEGSVNLRQTVWAGDPPVTDTVDWTATQSGEWFAMVNLNAPHFDNEGGPGIGWEVNDLAPEDGGTCVEIDGDGACSNQEIFATLMMDADARIQELLEGLESEDPALLADTVILVLGDNGSQANVLEAPWLPGGERMMAGKFTVYESGVRAPFILARGCDWMDQADGAFDGLLDGVEPACADTAVPMVTPGLTIDARVQVQDVYATIAELAGATDPVPASSVSLVPCFSADAATAGDCGSAELGGRGVYTEWFIRPYTSASAYGTTGVADTGGAAIILDDYKVIASVQPMGTDRCTRFEFYDLVSDPFELNDLRVGGGSQTAAQLAGYTAARVYLRDTVAPDWFASRNCSNDSAWDLDHDGYDGVVYGGTDCNDASPGIKPNAVEVWYDGIDQNCDALDDYDYDRDGSRAPSGGGTDCDDTNAAVNPTAVETCNGVDDDCTGAADEGLLTPWYSDGDSDGFGVDGSVTLSCVAASGYVATPGDCDDTAASISPAGVEVCDGVDNNCDGAADEGVTLTWYRDLDADGYGKTGMTGSGCTVPAGYTLTPGDCNDRQAVIHPGARDYWYDGKDADCAGNDDFDADGDGYALWVFGGDDCDDGAGAINPGAVETPHDGRDSNCNRRDNY